MEKEVNQMMNSDLEMGNLDKSKLSESVSIVRECIPGVSVSQKLSPKRLSIKRDIDFDES